MRKTIIFTLFLILLSNLNADVETVWANVYGGEFSDGARSICCGVEGGYILAGYSYSYSERGSDLHIIKVDSNGTEIWNTVSGGTGWEAANSICKSIGNDGYLALGYTSSVGNGLRDYYLVKFNLSGEEIWSKSYGGSAIDIGQSIVATSDGYLLCGYTESFGNGLDDIYVIKVNAEGDSVWSQTYGCPRTDLGNSIIKASNGNFLIVGATGLYDNPGVNTASNSEIYVLEVNESGDVIQSNTYWCIDDDQGDFDYGYSICETIDGGYCLVGGTTAEGVDPMDVAVIKIDSELNMVWKRNLEFDYFYDFGRASCSATYDGGILVAGSTKSAFDNQNNAFLIKLDEDGETVWSEILGDLGSDAINSVIVTDEPSILLAGQTNSYGAGAYDFWLTKLNDFYLYPEFESDVVSGHLPLTVSFSDVSNAFPEITSYEWDFDDDDIIDSTDPEPMFTYNEVGTHSVSLTVSNEYSSETIEKTGYIRVFNGESGLEFDGEQGKVTIPGDGILNIQDKLTIEAAIQPFGYGENDNFGFGRVIDKQKYQLYLVKESTIFNNYSVAFCLYFEDNSYTIAMTPENSLPLYYWYYLTATYNSETEEIKIFISGVEQDLTFINEPNGLIADNSDFDFNIGNASNEQNTFHGIIDEVRIWNIVLQEEEISNNMSNYLSGIENGLVGYWQMNEGNGNTIFDLTENSDGIISDNVFWISGTSFIYTPIVDENNVNDFPNSKITKFYPNPFEKNNRLRTQKITIDYDITEFDSKYPISIDLFNLKGQKVENLFYGYNKKGENRITWDNSNKKINKLNSGIYFYQLKTKSSSQTCKLTILQ